MTSDGLHAFCEWLGDTWPSQLIQNVAWIIPASQTVHILAVSVVMASIVVFDLHLLGMMARRQPTAALGARFLPWIWPSLIVLLSTGIIQIVGEPSRSLENPAFQLKMLLLIGAITVTLSFQRPLRHDGAYWEMTAQRRLAARSLALVSLALWVGIACAGRWIAYMQST